MKPAIMRRRVVLPQPEGPRRKKSSPGAMSREMSSTTGGPPKDLQRLRMEMAVGMGRAW
jgi:hypothetical protein